jgi:hypothetical protein
VTLKPTRVVIELAPDVDLAGIIEWVSNLDSEKLEEAVLAEGDMSETWAQTAVRVLKEWASAGTD